MRREDFGTLDDGTAVHRWTLESAGVRVRVLTYGGIVQSAEAPDRRGRTAEVVLGHPDLKGYLTHTGPYFGALVGRYANRIAGGRFVLDERSYSLAPNDGENSLHGGAHGFDKKVWEAEEVDDGLRLSRVSAHGEEGFPGRLEVSATYSLDENGALHVAYEAVTDAPTVVNLTNHTYWNLGGVEEGRAASTAEHRLRIVAARLTPAGPDGIPTGEFALVEDTRFDYRRARPLGSGLDHNFVLDKGVTPLPEEFAELGDPGSGRVLTLSTTEPGVQVYTGDHLDGEPFGPGQGVALETQHFPDSPNRPGFPPTVLRPDEVYMSETVYALGVLD
ncbi:aldose epimerase family protein [Streptomyces physcomitrii]|uniref:Aldose 1-epimerase n=1 Tax=Streptomyces physcomitrii TaxID=2724184 RepID=A0ABX1H4Y8_9ACTN|nr:aldose epimerase family protein [Streptomyces physcomitrii]NKI43117.1 galactose mutarotase [Streptomyces physcomitrii]